MKAVAYGAVTMVGYGGEFPRPYGNCFSLKVKKLASGYTRIVNFGYENLAELFRRKIIEWPIEVEILDEKRGIIVDNRIPKEWYSPTWCTVCCPEHLIPEEYKHKPVEVDTDKPHITPAEWKYIELKGYMSSVDDVPRFGIKKGWMCMNCKSMVYLDKCPNDECYNFYQYLNYTSDRAMDKEFWDMLERQGIYI